MHDPDVVAFEIHRPWPQRSTFSDGDIRRGVRWRARLHHDHRDCDCADRVRNPFPWWRARSWSSFWVVAGRGIYWPALVTVWHREPGGRDSGTVCEHWHRDGDRTRFIRTWRWHVWHWRIQVHPAQHFRRWAFTRCAWCAGRSTKTDPVNSSNQWHGPRGRWWRGEPGLFHHDCIAIDRAHNTCLCVNPLLMHGDYGQCVRCAKFRPFGAKPAWVDRQRILAEVPAGTRDRAAYDRVCAMVAEECDNADA